MPAYIYPSFCLLSFGCLSYVVEEDETQATFTGREQRNGVWILSFLVAGLFDRVASANQSHAGVAAGACNTGDEEARRLLESLYLEDIAHLDGQGDVRGNEEPASTKGKSKSHATRAFDWAAYRAVFKDTPYHAAVTALFAEYALLVGRLTRHLGAATATPLTLSEGASIAQQAQDFILGYVNPVLGPMHTTKFHRVLCHILHAVRYHGNILNANTSANEGGHKRDKKHYAHTNKRPGFTRQLVRHAHGTRSVLRRNAEALKSAEGAAANEDRQVSGDGGYAADNDSTPLPPRQARVAHLPTERVGKLASQSGMASLASVLGALDQDRIAVPSQLFFMARPPHGAPIRQMVHASPAYHGSSWYDHVEFLPTATADRAAALYGQVRLLVRYKSGVDHAVVAQMHVAEDAEECPLSARGCIQLRWIVDQAANADEGCQQVKLCLVPMASILRVAHVVPDCAEMARREGIGGTPPSFGTSDARMWSMLYLVNVFLPDKEQ